MTAEPTTTSRPGFDLQLAEALLVVPVVRPDAPRHANLAPFDGADLLAIPYSGVDDVDLAFDTARSAQARWAGTDLADRKRAMLRFHDLLLTHRDEGLDLIQWETGKTRIDALRELLGVCAVARHYARDAARLLGPDRRLGAAPLLTGVTIERHPVGVVGVISPWSYPLLLACADAIPAIMAGNAVVLKPGRETPLTALWAVDLMHRAGISRRVMQVVVGRGDELGPRIVERADHVAFTGSAPVGSQVAARCGERIIGCSLSLGGKNPLVVVDDADPGTAAEIAVRACFDNAGQLCVSMERIYVLPGIHDAFMERFVSRISALRMRAEVGWGADYGSLIGPGQLARTSEVVADAVAKGATVVTGGRPRPDVGPFYYAPTVLADVTDDMTAHSEETLGPVVSVERVPTVEEAVARANDSQFGLNASVISGSGRTGARIARRIRAGSVNVNEAHQAALGSTRAPMGGMGRSGVGRRNGDQGLTRFTEEQTIAVQRGLGFGTPFGMDHADWGQFLVRGTQLMRRLGLK
jgi:succinate-semialdehyde dehydrogenase/glutarate-semialdehyde dehydrogenase